MNESVLASLGRETSWNDSSNISLSAPDRDFHQILKIDPTLKTLTVVINILLGVIICVGSCLTLTSLALMNISSMPYDLYIKTLISSDFLVGFFLIFKALRDIPSIGWAISDLKHVCHLFRGVSLTSNSLALLSLTGVSVDRCISIVMPLRHRKLVSKPTITNTVLVLMWLVSILYGCLPFISSLERCRNYKKNNILGLRYSLFGFFITMMLVVSVCYLLIGWTFYTKYLKFSIRRSPTSSQSTEARKETQARVSHFEGRQEDNSMMMKEDMCIWSVHESSVLGRNENQGKPSLSMESSLNQDNGKRRETMRIVNKKNDRKNTMTRVTNDITAQGIPSTENIQKFDNSREDMGREKQGSRSPSHPQTQSFALQTVSSCDRRNVNVTLPPASQLIKSKAVRRSMKLVKTSLLLVSVFFVCFLPSNILIVFIEKFHVPDVILTSLTTLKSFNSALNFFIYILSNQRYRRAMKAVLCFCGRHGHVNGSM